MFSLQANPSYVPGGVENFWTREPTGQTGQVTSQLGQVAVTPVNIVDVKPASFGTWFFGGKTETQTSVADFGDRKDEMTGHKRAAGPAAREKWRLDEVKLPNLFKFQQFHDNL